MDTYSRTKIVLISVNFEWKMFHWNLYFQFKIYVNNLENARANKKSIEF